jgi:1-aminocyclopropane-1-carboxylate deaminase/D-cysteine desulfhydrase-like pyridoxal-dependent ACC family enzyme
MNGLPPDWLHDLEINGPTWRLLRVWAKEKKQQKIDLLVSSGSHDTSNQIRGAITMLNELLALEHAAVRR